MNPILFEPQQNAPMSSGVSLYENETINPYKEEFPLELPKAVERPQEEGALARYLREEKEREDAALLAKQEQERRQQEYMDTLSPFDLSTAGIINKSDVVSRGINQQFEQDFGWLGGEPYPGWTKFKSSNYPEFDKLQPEQQVEAFDYWQNNAVKFYAGYGRVDQNEVFRKIEDVLLANEDIRNAETQSIINRRKASDYNPPGLGDGEWQSGNVGFDSTRANIFAANSLDEAKKAYEALNRLKANQIVDENGNLNQAGWDEYNRLMQGEENDLIQAQDDLNFLSKFGDNKPEGIRKALDAARDFSRLSQLAMTNADPIVSETLSGQRKIADPITGSQTTVPLSGFDTAKNILLNPIDFTSFTVGMSIAQQADLLEETLTGVAVGAGTVGLAASGVSAMAAGNQEAALVASDLFQQTMRDNGLDPYNLDDWRKAYDGGIIEKAIRDGERTGQLKGQTTSAVETALDTLLGIGLKRIPVLGSTATGLKGIAKRFATSAPLSMLSAGAGEAAGQVAAYDKVNWNEVVAEGMMDPLGQLGMQTPAELAKYTGNKIFGKKVEAPATEPTQEATPAPEATAAATEVPYKDEAEVETELENKVRNVKPTGTTQEGTGTVTPNTQEVSTQEDAGDGAVTGTGRQAVAEPPKVEEGYVRMYHGGVPGEGARWVSPNIEYAQGYADKSGGVVQYVDIPADSPLLRKAFDDSGTSVTAPFVAFEAPAEIMAGAKTIRGTTKQSPAQQSAEAIDRALTQEEELRRSERGAELLNAQLEGEQRGLTEAEAVDAARVKNLSPEERRTLIASNIRKTFPDTQELINKIEQYTDSDEKADVDIDVAGIQDLIEAINQLEPERTARPTQETTPTPAVEVAPQEFSDSFRKENDTLPKKAQAAWTPEAYAAVDNFFATGNEDSLAGLNKVQQNRAKAHYYGTIEEREAQAKGMSVEQAYNKRRNQGGFLDIPALGNGVAEAAVTAWTKAKDFASWSAEMVDNFGNKAVPYLRDLWNRLNSLIRNVGEFLTYTPNARARQRGSVDLRQSKPPLTQQESNIEGNPNLGKNQQRASLIRKTKAFFGGKIPANVTFVNDRSEGNKFVARINTTLTGQADIEINYAFADDSNIDAALHEEIGHYASNRGLLTDFYNSLTPTEKADVDAAVAMYGKSEARMAETSIAALQAEERLAKSFAAIASRNKDLWTRIKNLVNKILAKLGLAKANTDNQVADIFLRTMNAYKNQRENNADMTNRRMHLSKAASKSDLNKEAAKIDKSKSKTITSFLNTINITYLSKADRNALSKYIADLVAEAKGLDITNETIAASKTKFDRIMEELRKYKDISWTKEFAALQARYPQSLAGKSKDEFTSGKEVRAFVSKQANTEGDELRDNKEKQAQARDEKQAAKVGESVTLALEAQSKLPDILDSAPYKELTRENRIHVLKAMSYLQDIDPTTQTQRQNEALVATINNALEGNIIGFGKYSVQYAINQFDKDLKALLAANGGKIPFYQNDSKVASAIQKTAEAYVSGGMSDFFKKEARERMIFSSPQVRQLWTAHFGDYINSVQTRSSALQNEIKHELEKIMEENGLQKRTYVGALNIADKDLFNTDIEKQKERIMYAAMMTQWTEGSNDPIAEINSIINDIAKGIDELTEYGPFQGAKGASNKASFLSVLKPALDAGLITFVDNKYEVQATPDVWSDFLIRNLKDNEAKALADIRKLTSKLQPELKFTKEFWYGESFDTVVNYVPRVAFAINQKEVNMNAPELDSVDTPDPQPGTSMKAHGSVFHTRKGLGAGQYYGSALDVAVLHSMNTAAYEIATAPTRFKLNEILKEYPNNKEKNERFLPFFGNDNRSAVLRRANIRQLYKELHKAELKREVGVKSPSSTPGIIAVSLFDDISSFIVNSMIATLKNGIAQWIAPVSGAVVIAGKHIYDGSAQVRTWKRPELETFFQQGFPDLINRKDTIDPIFDKNISSNILDVIASIDLKGNLDTLTKAQKAWIYTARTKQVGMGLLGGVPKFLSKLTNASPDAKAAEMVFPGLFLNRLIENGIIRKADEMTPDIIFNPQAQESLAQAKRDMSDVFGAANRFTLRPTMFVDKGNAWRNVIATNLFGLMQIASGFAGDRIVDIKDMNYYNSKDPFAGRIRKDARKRMTAALIQNAVFKASSIAISYTVGYLLISAFKNIEGLDEEEKQLLANLDKLKSNLRVAGPKGFQQYMLETATMMFGPAAANALGEGSLDWTSRKILSYLLKEDYDAEVKRLETQIKKIRNPSEKADLQLELAILKENGKILNTFFSGPDFGPVAGGVGDILSGRNSFDDLEYDRIAMEYYKAGGPIKKPDRNWAIGMLRKGAGMVVPDIGRASNDIGKARKAIALKREQKLDTMKRQGKTRVSEINVPAL